MPFFTFWKRSLICLTLLVGGCSLSPHNSHLKKDALQLQQQVTAWPRVSASQLTEATKTTYLNQLIYSEQLNGLIKEAFAANPNLQQILLTLQIRQVEQTRISGSHLPSLQAGLTASKEEEGNATYTGSISISWEADLWQKLSDESTAAAKDTGEQLALYQSAHDTLASEVMKAWLGLIAQQHSIRIQQQRLHVLQQNKLFVAQRYRNGLGNSEDLSSARSSLSSARAVLAQYQESLAQQQRSLQTLLGRTLRSTVEIPEDYPAVILPLADLPEQTLQRRPDLQAAYLAIEAASLRSSAAYKDLLPSINIQAALQDMAESPRAALLTNPLWSLLGQLTAPLYQGGELTAAAEITDLKIASAYQNYRDTLLTAVTEVEDALGLEQSLKQRQYHIEQALTSSHNSFAQYQRSYRSGLSNILDLLIVERNTYDLEAQRDNLIYQHLSNRINLGLALGLGVSE